MTDTPEKLADLNKRIEEEEKRYDNVYTTEEEEKDEDKEHQERLRKFQSYLFSGNTMSTDDLIDKIVGIIDNNTEGAKLSKESQDAKKEAVNDATNDATSGNQTKQFEYYYKGVKYHSDEPLHYDDEDSYNSDEN
jgi:hypothetical protein